MLSAETCNSATRENSLQYFADNNPGGQAYYSKGSVEQMLAEDHVRLYDMEHI